MLHPLLVVEIPVDGQDDALLERGLGVPAQIVLDLGGVDAVAAVVTQTVSDVLAAVVNLRTGFNLNREVGSRFLRGMDNLSRIPGSAEGRAV